MEIYWTFECNVYQWLFEEKKFFLLLALIIYQFLEYISQFLSDTEFNKLFFKSTNFENTGLKDGLWARYSLIG